MVLEGRLELPRIAPLAPQASASAIPPPELYSDVTAYNIALNSEFSIVLFVFFCKIADLLIEKVNAHGKKIC